MNKKTLISALALPLVAVTMTLSGCHGTTDGNTTGIDSDSIQKTKLPSEDTLLVITMPENSIWGHLGEDTGMSVLEFITDDGDTLYVNKTNEQTGQDGQLMGSVRNYTDRFCMQLTPDSQTLIKAVNVTELQDIWSSGKDIEN